MTSPLGSTTVKLEERTVSLEGFQGLANTEERQLT